MWLGPWMQLLRNCILRSSLCYKGWAFTPREFRFHTAPIETRRTRQIRCNSVSGVDRSLTQTSHWKGATSQLHPIKIYVDSISDWLVARFAVGFVRENQVMLFQRVGAGRFLMYICCCKGSHKKPWHSSERLRKAIHLFSLSFLWPLMF